MTMRKLLLGAALCLGLSPLVTMAEPAPPSSTPAKSKKAKTPAKKPATPTTTDATPVQDAGPAGPMTAAALVARVQTFYEATSDLHARFDQEVTSVMRGTQRASGQVWLKKPGRMRWEYEQPTSQKKLMVADGETLWIYQAEEEQAFRHALADSSLPASVSFLFGKGRLADEFDVTREAIDQAAGAARRLGDGEALLKLVPKQATAQYRYLEFAVDEASGLVRQTWLYDQQGGTNHFTFRDVETNRGVADSRFHFAPPAGTRIIQAP